MINECAERDVCAYWTKLTNTNDQVFVNLTSHSFLLCVSSARAQIK